MEKHILNQKQTHVKWGAMESGCEKFERSVSEAQSRRVMEWERSSEQAELSVEILLK